MTDGAVPKCSKWWAGETPDSGSGCQTKEKMLRAIDFVRTYAVPRPAGSRQEDVTAEAILRELREAAAGAAAKPVSEAAAGAAAEAAEEACTAGGVRIWKETFSFRSERFDGWAADGRLPRGGEDGYASFDGARFREPIRSCNVAALIPGTDAEAEKENATGLLSFSAHFDSVPGSPGAYDNLAANAILLNLFRHYLAHRPRRTLLFLFCGAEEPGLCGSRAFAIRHGRELERDLFHCNIDLSGQEGGTDVLGVTAEPEVCSVLSGLLGRRGFPVETKNQIWSSDSNSFAEAGIPSLTLDRDGIGMHTAEDTADRISEDVIAYQTELIRTITDALDHAEPLPFPETVPQAMREELRHQFQSGETEIFV